MKRRIQVIGASGSGKTTVAARLATILGIPHVELDALHWLPGWIERDGDGFRALVRDAVAGDGWVVDGNYTRLVDDLLGERVEMIVWLDLPLHLTVARQLHRSWRRARAREMLWGTNVERFWPQLAIWNRERSIVGYSLATHRRRRRQSLALMRDVCRSHRRFVRLTSPRQVERFVASVEARVRAERAEVP